MPGLIDIEQSIKLEDGKDFVGLYDPTKEVRVIEGGDFGTRYTFRFLAKDGKVVKLTGGSRLFDRMLSVCTDGKPKEQWLTPRWLKVTAHGKVATMDRDYFVEEIPNPIA